jgi:glycine/D-amino acid oxidase-like deaminating enzyme/nitrite reductase/ring-hydroxylating ferredoxin subunit
MGSRTEANPSLWIATSSEARTRPQWPSDHVDVAVVGAGIAGLTTARLLAAEGASVVVVDAGEVAAGATGYTTAKVTALQRTTLSEIVARHGAERAAAYADANRAAVERVAELATADAIDCELERAPACTFTVAADAVGEIEAEHAAALGAGLPTRLDADTELPLDVAAAVWLDDQVQFHPRRYCLGLVDAIVQSGGAVLEHTRALGVERRTGGCMVTTASGTIDAGHVVVASHLPFLDRGGFFARAHPYRSYALAVRLEGERIGGMYISAESPTRSIRSTPGGWTILGGEGHKVGHDPDTRERYGALDGWARHHFPVAEVGYRWSAQDYESVDGLPYVGRLTPGRGRIWVATAFRKWGMSNGTAAAMILSDLISGRDNPWAETFDATRLAPGASLKSLVTENLEVGKRFVIDRVKTRHPQPVEELATGEGAIAELDGEPVAAYRDEDGTLHTVAPNCTHLGCRVAFNTAERSWDCPCHGSRFDVDGHVLEGPATEDLARRVESSQ